MPLTFLIITNLQGLSLEWKGMLLNSGITERQFYDYPEKIISILKSTSAESKPLVAHPAKNLPRLGS